MADAAHTDPTALAYWPHPTVGRVDITPSADRQSAVATWRGDPQVERPTDGWLTAHATNAWGGLWAVVRWMDETASDDLEKRGEAHLRRVRTVTLRTREHPLDLRSPNYDLVRERLRAFEAPFAEVALADAPSRVLDVHLDLPDGPLVGTATVDVDGKRTVHLDPTHPCSDALRRTLDRGFPQVAVVARRHPSGRPVLVIEAVPATAMRTLPQTVTPGEHTPSPDERIRLDRPVQNDVNDRRSVQKTEKIILFAGCDPGAKGACAVLAVADAPDTDAHGRILAVDVFDLPTVTRVDGGTDLDVVAYSTRFHDVLEGMADSRARRSPHVIIERPQVTGGQRFRKTSLVTQAINVGAVWATSLQTVNAWSDDGSALVEWASSSATGGWRSELGGVTKGEEVGAVMAMRTNLADPYGSAAFTSTVAADGQILNDARPDRLVAVLLAEVARRRWLGTAVPQGARKSKDKAAKSRKKDARKAAVERAVAPLTVAKARTEALAGSECPDPAHRVHQANAPHVPRGWCTRTMRCCEARLLDWAWRQRPWRPRPDQPEAALPGLKASPIVDLMHVAAIYRKTVKSKAWTVAKGLVHSFETSKMDDATFDALESNGLLQLIPGVKSVRYRPTERGLEWARRLRGGETT